MEIVVIVGMFPEAASEPPPVDSRLSPPSSIQFHSTLPSAEQSTMANAANTPAPGAALDASSLGSQEMERLMLVCLEKQKPVLFKANAATAHVAAMEFINLFVTANINPGQLVSVRIYESNETGSRVKQIVKRPWGSFVRDLVSGASFRQQLFDFPLQSDFEPLTNLPIASASGVGAATAAPSSDASPQKRRKTGLAPAAANVLMTEEDVSANADNVVITLQQIMPELFGKFASTLPCSQFAFGERNCSSFLPPIAKPVLFQSYASTGLSFTSLHVDHGGAAMNQVVWAGGGNSATPNDTPTTDVYPTGFVASTSFQHADVNVVVAIWTFFAAQDLDDVENYLKTLPRMANGTPCSVFANNCFLTGHDLKALSAAPWNVQHVVVQQRLGDTVLVPVNCAHQVQNLCNNYKVAVRIHRGSYLFIHSTSSLTLVLCDARLIFCHPAPLSNN